MTYITNPCATAPSRPTLFSGLATRLAVWRQRRALKALDRHALEDIGVTRLEANTEAQRSFWDAPETWRY
ncbi:MAG: hypothetical protein COB16_04600 [Rhodobacteraceae bacterium]|nr:MAG: hypothetical protein COB16_04600 [Paracoccaceae bacterium]